MQTLYTISPLILSEQIPERTSIEYAVSKYFHLFNIYSKNPYVVREYMRFIDANFDFAFSKLRYRMVSYQYPKELEEVPSDIITYINTRYKLTEQTKLDLGYRANHFEVYDYILGKKFSMILNDYALYDAKFMYGGLYDVDSEIMGNLLEEINYLWYNQGIRRLIHTMLIYDSAISDVMADIPDPFSYEAVSEPLLALSQLKFFIKNYMKEEL